jgi:hypothetical protein
MRQDGILEAIKFVCFSQLSLLPQRSRRRPQTPTRLEDHRRHNFIPGREIEPPAGIFGSRESISY